MNIKIVAAGILLIVLALVVSVNAIEIKTSDDSISIHSTEGKFFAYVKNTAQDRRDLYLSVSAEQLSAFVEPYSTTIAAGATSGAYIRVTAPDCFRGSEVVIIHAQLCSSTSCETASRKVVVDVTPAKFCSSYIDGYATDVQFIPGTSCGSNGCYGVNSIEPRQSRLVNSQSFDPIGYDLRIVGGDKCIKVLRGEIGRVRLTLSNRGAAANYDLRVVTDSNLDAYTSKDYVSLQRSATEDVYVDIKPLLDSQPVRQFVTFQALHLDDLIAQKDVCIEMSDEFKTLLAVPSAASATTSKDLTIQVEITNQGTTAQRYTLSVSNSKLEGKISLEPQDFLLKPGAKKIVDVEIATSGIRPGSYRLNYLAISEETQESADTVLTISRGNGGAIQPAGNLQLDLENEQKDNVLKVSATIRNEGESNLEGLTMSVLGLPSGWAISEISPLSIAANSEELVEFEITMNSADEVMPLLVVKQAGKTIASEALPKISGKAGGFSGLFTLNSQNIVLGLIVLAGILVFLMIGRRPDETSRHDSGHDQHGHLESIKHETSGHAH